MHFIRRPPTPYSVLDGKYIFQYDQVDLLHLHGDGAKKRGGWHSVLATLPVVLYNFTNLGILVLYISNVKVCDLLNYR